MELNSRDECSFMFTLFLRSSRGRGAMIVLLGLLWTMATTFVHRKERWMIGKLDDKFVALLDVIWRLSQ